jgi:hypothetical protein
VALSLSDVLARCTSLSNRDIHTADEAIDFLQSKLPNNFDPLFNDVLQLARDLKAFCPREMRQRLQELINRYDVHGGVEPVTVNQFRELSHPEDEDWLNYAQQFQHGGEPSTIKVFGESYTRVVANALRGDTDEDAVLLQQWQPIIREVARLNDKLNAAQRMQLKLWLEQVKQAQQHLQAEALMTGLTDLPARIHAASGDLTTLMEEAKQLALDAQNEGQNRFAIKLKAQLQQFANWQMLFTQMVSALQNWDFAQPYFPWSSTEGSSIPPLSTQQLRDCSEGILRWPVKMYQNQWLKVLQRLAEEGLNRVLAMSDSNLVQLKTLDDMRYDWPDYFKSSCSLDSWGATDTQLKAGLNTEVVEKLQHLKCTYNGVDDLIQALNTDYFYKVQRFTCVETDKFRQEFATIQLLREHYQQWWHDGEVMVLKDNRLVDAQERLLALDTKWGISQGVIKLNNDLAHLQQELKSLDTARVLFAQAEYNQAMGAVSPLNSPAALLLKNQIQQLTIDSEVSAHIELGQFERITDTHLEQVTEVVRNDYYAYQRGEQFIAEQERTINALSAIESLTEFVSRALQLKSAQVDSNVKLCKPARHRHSALINDIQELLGERLEQEIIRLDEQILSFPLTEVADITERREDLVQIKQVIQTGGMHQQLQAVLLSQLEPVEFKLSIHQHCHDAQWEQARSELDNQSQISRQLRHDLQGTVGFCQLSEADSNNVAAWLDLYRLHHALLLNDDHGKKHYLVLLRNMEIGQIEAGDVDILISIGSSERYLISLLRCSLNPDAVNQIEGRPKKADFPLLRGLLDDWASNMERVEQLGKLWDGLNNTICEQIWPQTSSPVELLNLQIRQRFDQLEVLLSDPNQSLPELKNLMDRLDPTGQISPVAMKDINRAIHLDRVMADMNRYDPWADSHLTTLNDTEHKLDKFPYAVRRARGWSDAIKFRRSEIKFWGDLEKSWIDFRSRFDHRDLFFSLNSEPWADLMELLQGWCQQLTLFSSELRWDVPNAAESQRWQKLIKGWSQSPEGILWLGLNNPQPVNPVQLNDDYQTMLVQMQLFSQLHQNLLLSFPNQSAIDSGSLTGQQKLWLKELQGIQPVTQPVAKIKAQLTDPDIGVTGKIYQRFTRETGERND